MNTGSAHPHTKAINMLKTVIRLVNLPMPPGIPPGMPPCADMAANIFDCTTAPTTMPNKAPMILNTAQTRASGTLQRQRLAKPIPATSRSADTGVLTTAPRMVSHRISLRA